MNFVARPTLQTSKCFFVQDKQRHTGVLVIAIIGVFTLKVRESKSYSILLYYSSGDR